MQASVSRNRLRPYLPLSNCSSQPFLTPTQSTSFQPAVFMRSSVVKIYTPLVGIPSKAHFPPCRHHITGTREDVGRKNRAQINADLFQPDHFGRLLRTIKPLLRHSQTSKSGQIRTFKEATKPVLCMDHMDAYKHHINTYKYRSCHHFYTRRCRTTKQYIRKVIDKLTRRLVERLVDGLVGLMVS